MELSKVKKIKGKNMKILLEGQITKWYLQNAGDYVGFGISRLNGRLMGFTMMF